jgi:hypothetical protein
MKRKGKSMFMVLVLSKLQKIQSNSQRDNQCQCCSSLSDEDESVEMLLGKLLGLKM